MDGEALMKNKEITEDKSKIVKSALGLLKSSSTDTKKKTNPFTIPGKIKGKFAKGVKRGKGEGRTLTTGLTKGYGLNTGKHNISLAPTKMVRLDKKLLKTKTASHGSTAKPRGIGIALRGYGKAMK
ncbi:MAG TPA: hypothetical protein DCS66_06525 [Flavobacteriaceae bacterium]|nr:hypothetical protein [Flavobacteriaceae bacterium]